MEYHVLSSLLHAGNLFVKGDMIVLDAVDAAPLTELMAGSW